METYETVFITLPTLTEDEERSTVGDMTEIITSGGGAITTTDRMGRRRLAYPIRKHQDGIYVRFLYDSDAAVPKELERRMRLSESVLRALTVKLEPQWAVAAKEQAVRDEQARIEAEREAAAAAAAAEAAAAAGETGEGGEGGETGEAGEAGEAGAPSAGTAEVGGAPAAEGAADDEGR